MKISPYQYLHRLAAFVITVLLISTGCQFVPSANAAVTAEPAAAKD